MNEISLMITVTREQQVSVEEHCINAGLSISAYFMALHEQFQRYVKEDIPTSTKWISKEEAKKLFPDSHKEKDKQEDMLTVNDGLDIKEEEPIRKKKHSK